MNDVENDWDCIEIFFLNFLPSQLFHISYSSKPERWKENGWKTLAQNFTHVQLVSSYRVYWPSPFFVIISLLLSRVQQLLLLRASDNKCVCGVRFLRVELVFRILCVCVCMNESLVCVYSSYIYGDNRKRIKKENKVHGRYLLEGIFGAISSFVCHAWTKMVLGSWEWRIV